MAFEKTDSLAAYLVELNKSKVLSKEDELKLADKIQEGCLVSLHKLVNANLRFAIKRAQSFQGMGLSYDDLIQEANMALIDCAKRYTSDKNVKFVSYAGWYIQKALNEAVVNKGKVVRLPMHKEIELYKKRQAGETIAHSRSVRVDKPVGDDGKNTIGDILLNAAPEAEIQATVDDIKHRLDAALDMIKPRDKDIIKAVYGVGRDYEVPVDILAEEYGMTTTRINQIIRSAKAQLKSVLD